MLAVRYNQCPTIRMLNPRSTCEQSGRIDLHVFSLIAHSSCDAPKLKQRLKFVGLCRAAVETRRTYLSKIGDRMCYCWLLRELRPLILSCRYSASASPKPKPKPKPMSKPRAQVAGAYPAWGKGGHSPPPPVEVIAPPQLEKFFCCIVYCP